VTRRKKTLLDMPDSSDFFDNEEEGQECQGMAGVAIASSSSIKASTSSSKISTISFSQ
jgi:hypothetical protein